MISRRKWMAGGVAGAAGVAVAGHQGLLPPDAVGIYGCGHTLTYAAQRLLAGNANAREFAPSQISKTPHPTARPPKGEEFARLQAGGFKDWKLQVDGMVERPVTLSLGTIQVYPSRSQITQLICE